MTISSIALSRILEKDEPDLSLKLFPVNIEAYLNRATALLRRQQDPAALSSLQTDLQRRIPTHAGDARLYSLLGEIHRQSGRQIEAYGAFEQALALSKTEVNALLWTIERSLQQSNTQAALDQIDTLLRRWPERIAPLAPLIANIFATTESYKVFIRRIERAPPWRAGLIDAFSRDPNTFTFAARIIQDLAASPNPPSNGEIVRVISDLVGAKQYDLAYRTFLLTLASAGSEVVGHIYNGRFTIRPSGRPFDWQIRGHPGLTVTYLGLDENPARTGLQIRFNNAPVRNLSIRQLLFLTAGSYELSFNSAASDARLPKGLIWRLACVGSNKILAEAIIMPATYEMAAFETKFTVPDDACPAQVLFLATKAIGENWNDRYSGSIIFDNFRIIEVDS